MTSAVIPFEQSATMPMVTKEDVRLVRKLEKGASFQEIFVFLLHQTEMVASIQPDKLEDYKLLARVMHCIDRTMLRAILTKTVGHQYFKPTDRPSSKDPGAYVAAIAIWGRHGRFVNGKELEILLQDMRGYILVTRDGSNGHCNGYRQLRPGFEHLESGPAFPMPSLRQHPTQVLNLQSCVDMLQRWSDTMTDKEQYILQSPLMVGNSAEADVQIPHHDSNSQGYSTTQGWDLTLACLQYHDLCPVIVVVPVTRAWEEVQVNASEVLVTLLAASMTSLRGFNVKQPGTWSATPSLENRAFEDAKMNVFANFDTFAENAAASLEYMDRVEKKCATLNIPAIKKEIEHYNSLRAILCEQKKQLARIDEWKAKRAERLQKVIERGNKIIEDSKKETE